jgi:SNF2 family DNA or RNA helicase
MPEPYPFQRELVARLGVQEIKGRLIGDEPGLGKTYEALWIHQKLVAGYNHQNLWAQRMQRTLVLAPWSVHEAWARHIRMVFPEAKIVTIDRKKRQPFIDAVRAGRADFYICHYEAIILKDMQSVLRVQWFHVIADEIHRIKSEKSKARLAVRQLKTIYKTGMSASIAEDKPQDIWSPLNWVAFQQFPSLKKFKTDWCSTTEVQGRVIDIDDEGEPIRIVHNVVSGFRKDRLDEFHELVAPYFMRRTKAEVGIDLPDKYYTVINVSLPPKQRKLYDTIRKKMTIWIGEHEDQKLSITQTLSRIVRLQQAALATMAFENGIITLEPSETGKRPKVELIEPSAKLDALVDWLQGRDEQVVIFSQSRSMIDLVDRRLRKAGLRVGKYTGATRDKDRQPIIDNFQAGKLDVFAGTIKAGGESITLTAASTVAFLDRAWGPLRNMQAEDRVHRIGQTNAVQVVDFFAPDTVDSKVRNTNITKWSELKALLGDPT